MFNNITIELIKTFSDEDVKNFGEYINCPLFNKRKELIKLYSVIIKCRPDYTNPVLKRERLFKKLYPQSRYDEQTLRSRMAELSSLIRGFLTYAYLQKNSFRQKMIQAKELMDRQKYTLSEKILKDALEVLEKNKFSDPEYLENKYNVLTELCSVLSAEENYKERLKAEISRAECYVNLFLKDILISAKDIITLNIHNKDSMHSDYVNEFLKNLSIENFLMYLKNSENGFFNITAIYYYTYLTRKENYNEEHYFKLKEIIFREYSKFSKKDLFKFWDFLSGAVYPTLFNKDKKFYNERFEVDRFFAELDAFLTINEKYMYSQTFTNVFAGAAIVNELEWAEDFIIQNKEKLLPETRENTFNYCMALLHSKKKEYDKSLGYLGKIKFAELSYNLDVRMSYMMNYYELNLFEQLYSSIDAYKHFISDNNNIPEHRIDWAKNSLKFMTKIAKAKSENKKISYADLKEAESVDSFMNRKWILEKMKELV